MLKLGVVRVEDLASPKSLLLGREQHASFLLLEALASAKHEDFGAYDTLVSRVRLANGTWKQTASGRLREADDLLLKILKRRYPKGSHLTITDLAVSTGVTSVELFDMVRSWFSVDFVASDLYRDAFAITSSRLRWTVILDQSGEELQHVWGPFVLPGQLKESAWYPVNRILKVLSRHFFVPRARMVIARQDRNESPYFAVEQVNKYEIRRLPLFSYRCLKLIDQTTNFRFEVIDVLEPIRRRAQVVRAMNIISLAHFGELGVRAAIQHCVDAVKPGGFLIIGHCSSVVSSPDLNATVYQVSEQEVSPIARIKGGDQFEEMVYATRKQRAAPSGEGEVHRRAPSL